MRPIGFSTGALALSDFQLALDELHGQPVNSVELSALRLPELRPLLEALAGLDRTTFKHVSVHAPSSFTPEEEVEVVELLRRYVRKDIPVVVHPDTIHNASLWASLRGQLAIENMDRRKPVGRTADELSVVFERLPEARLCFDIGHARQCDTTMTEAYRILKRFRDRLCRLHISEVNSASLHERLSYAAIHAFSEVADLIPEWVPAILESRVSRDQVGEEIRNARKALTAHQYAQPIS